MSELQERLNALSGRGTPRGVDAVFDEATRIATTTNDAEIEVDELDPIPFVTTEPTRKRRRPMSSLIAATGTLTLLLVSMMAVAAFLGNGGANSPEGAVRKLADAISHEDPLAAADVMAPSEVQSLHGTLDAASKRAAELALVQQAGAPLSGLDFNVDDLTMTTEELGPDHAKVRIQGGAIRARTEHEKFSPLVQRALGEPSTNEGSVNLADGWDNVNELFVVAVREDGDWYISAAYTALEYLRVSSDLPAAEFGSGVTDIATLGADTPQTAVENGMRALQASDWPALIALADPKELPLYDYRAALTELAARDETRTDFTITAMATKATVSGDTAKVRLTASGKTSSGDSWSLDGGCFTPPASGYMTMDGEQVPTDEVPPSCVGNRFGIGYGLLYGFGGSNEAGGVSEITVVERDGRWFVSPVGTALDILDNWIANMDQRTLYVLLQQPEQLPPDGRLTFGTPVTLPSTMGNWGAAVYEFDGKAGQEVVAHFPADDDDPWAWSYNAFILNPDGSYVSDGDMPIYGNAVELPANGTYRIVLTTFFGEQAEFTLWDVKNAPAAALKSQGQTCTYEGGGSTSCSSTGFGSESANGERVGETTPTTAMPEGETCVESSDGGYECSSSSSATESDTAPVAVENAPTTIP